MGHWGWGGGTKPSTDDGGTDMVKRYLKKLCFSWGITTFLYNSIYQFLWTNLANRYHVIAMEIANAKKKYFKISP